MAGISKPDVGSFLKLVQSLVTNESPVSHFYDSRQIMTHDFELFLLVNLGFSGCGMICGCVISISICLLLRI